MDMARLTHISTHVKGQIGGNTLYCKIHDIRQDVVDGRDDIAFKHLLLIHVAYHARFDIRFANIQAVQFYILFV